MVMKLPEDLKHFRARRPDWFIYCRVAVVVCIVLYALGDRL